MGVKLQTPHLAANPFWPIPTFKVHRATAFMLDADDSCHSSIGHGDSDELDEASQ